MIETADDLYISLFHTQSTVYKLLVYIYNVFRYKNLSFYYLSQIIHYL